MKIKLYAKYFCFNYIKHYFQNFPPETGAFEVDKSNTLEMKDPWENEIYEMTNILPRDQAVNRITTYKGQRLSSLPLISTITATANRTEIKRKCRWGTQASKWGSRMVDTVSFKNDQWSLWQEKKKHGCLWRLATSCHFSGS